MSPIYEATLGLIMAGEAPPGVPRTVATRARYLGAIIACARSRSTIDAIGGALYVFPEGRHAVRINGRWLLTFDWDGALERANSLALDRI